MNHKNRKQSNNIFVYKQCYYRYDIVPLANKIVKKCIKMKGKK